MTISISRADVENAPDILALQKLAYKSEALLYGDCALPPLTQTLPEIEAEFASKIVLRAIEAGRIVGSVRASLSEHTCFVGRLVVHPDCRRQGIGTRLLLDIEEFFPAARRFELFTGTRSVDNIRLYQRLGYREYREEDQSPNVRLVFMEKRRTRAQSSV